MQEIARLQQSLVETKAGKDHALQSLNKELEIIQNEFRDENEKCREEYMDLRKKDVQTIKRLEDELKHRPEVLDIPPLNIVIIKESRLIAEVDNKNRIIERMKVEFQNSLAKKDEELKQKIAELEKSK